MKNKLRIFFQTALLGIITPWIFAEYNFNDFDKYPEIRFCEEYPEPFCDPCNKWYLGASGSLGWHNQTEINIPITNSNSSLAFVANPKTNWGINLAWGRYFSPWRLEVELSYKNNPTDSFDQINDTRLQSSDFSLKYRTFSLMLNTYYDLCIAERTTYYLGVGIGISHSRLRIQIDSPIYGRNSNDLCKYLFAAQGLTGITYALTNSIDMTLGYRLFVTSKPQNVENLPVSNNIDLGICYKF